MSLLRTRLDPNGVRHAEMSHAIEGGTANEDFRRLRVEGARGERISEDRLEAIHGGLCETALMIPTLALPGGATDLSDPAQIDISRMARALTITMPPDARATLRWNQNCERRAGGRPPRQQRIVTCDPIIRPIPRTPSQ